MNLNDFVLFPSSYQKFTSQSENFRKKSSNKLFFASMLSCFIFSVGTKDEKNDSWGQLEVTSVWSVFELLSALLMSVTRDAFCVITTVDDGVVDVAICGSFCVSSSRGPSFVAIVQRCRTAVCECTSVINNLVLLRLLTTTRVGWSRVPWIRLISISDIVQRLHPTAVRKQTSVIDNIVL